MNDNPREGRSGWPQGSTGRARLAVLVLLGSILVPLVTAGLRSVLWVLVGLAGSALAAMGVWWALAHTGAVKALGVVLSVGAPVTVLALYATSGMLWAACLSLALWVLAVALARTALAPGPSVVEQPVAKAPQQPWILMNPRSGGGKVGRFRLVEKARAAHCRVALLDGHQDVAALAQQAVDEGADLLAVAGGDGTQALVAEVAARNDLPFVVIPAGTRNHFALDLGLDRDDPAAALEALTDAVEIRVDLGYAANRVFVNNASFGTYASVVADPAYRNAKAHTVSQALPGLLRGVDPSRLRMRADGTYTEGLQRCSSATTRTGVPSTRPAPDAGSGSTRGGSAWCACGSTAPLRRRAWSAARAPGDSSG
nr:diacylglycerol kinase family protein [Streptomyces pristinaespiralis]